MSSTYSTNLAIELIGTGDQAGNWGSTTNTNLGTLLEQAISGYVTQAVSTGTDTTITIPNGASGVARNMFIELTGTGGTSTNLIVPANKKLYFIYNNASGAVTVKVSGQTGVSVPATAKVVLVSNGTDVIVAQNYIPTLISPTISNATLTGTPVAPTAASGTNTTQIATTAFVTTGLQAAYPVGSIYMSTVSTNPATLFGFGTWVTYGSGRMLISQDGTYTAGSTGGSAQITIGTANLPSHTHTATTTITDPGHTHTTNWSNINDFNSGSNPPGAEAAPDDIQGTFSITSNSSTTGITAATSIGSTGSGVSIDTISPYIAVYMWNRTV
jgi:microcystin-dependent protein